MAPRAKELRVPVNITVVRINKQARADLVKVESPRIWSENKVKNECNVFRPYSNYRYRLGSGVVKIFFRWVEDPSDQGISAPDRRKYCQKTKLNATLLSSFSSDEPYKII